MNDYKVHRNFCPIKVVDENRIPVDGGSSALVTYKGKRALFTVDHVINNPDPRAVMSMLEIQYDSTHGALNYNLVDPIREKLPPHLKNILKREYKDFAFYTNLPQDIQPLYTHIEREGNSYKTLHKTPRKIFELDLNILPNPGEKCHFAGLTRSQQIQVNSGAIKAERKSRLTEEWDAVFIGPCNDIPWYYAFELLAPQPNVNYKGCSGGPIFNPDGQVISLVQGGSTQAMRLYGINLTYFKDLIDQYF